MNKLMYLLALILFSGLYSCGERIYKAKIETEYGDITVELFNTTPQHRDNFVKLVKEGFYDDLLFHRVMNDFMIQGGDPLSKDAPMNKRLGTGGPGYNVPAEIGQLHYRGALASARMGGPTNPDKESNGSQFYLVQGRKKLTEMELQLAESRHQRIYTEEEKRKYLEGGGYPFLDNDYTVFGKIIEGLEVLDKITALETNGVDRPLHNVPMKIRIIR